MKPLSDLTIVELCHAQTPLHLRLAMAMASRLAADQGARVLCLAPVGPDPLEKVPPFLGDGASATQVFLTMGKEVLVPVDDADFSRAVDALLAQRPVGVILAEGDPLRARFAETGAAAIELASLPQEPGQDRSAQPTNAFGILASGGMLDIIGDPDREPLRLGGHQIAYAAGLSAFTALTAAIAQRDLDGRVLHARISLLETAVWMNWKAVVGAAEPPPHPTRRGDKAEFPVLRCKDGWVAFVYTPVQFERLEAMFAALALTDPRSLPAEQRAGALATQVAPWFAARTRAEIYAEAREYGIPIGPVYSPAELLEDEQYLARDFFVTGGPEDMARFPRLPMTWNGARLTPRPRRTVTLAELAEAAA